MAMAIAASMTMVLNMFHDSSSSGLVMSMESGSISGFLWLMLSDELLRLLCCERRGPSLG